MATAWLAVALWLYMALGETQLLSQPRMAMVAWAALFGLPPAYVRFRALAHAVANEATAAFSQLVAAGARLYNTVWSSVEDTHNQTVCLKALAALLGRIRLFEGPAEWR